MFQIKLSDEGAKKVREVADRYDVDSDKLFELYNQVMTSNFEQDLCDIANENEDYFEEGE